MTQDFSPAPSFHLPDPIYQSEFYKDVPMKRAAAWLVDILIIIALFSLIILLSGFVLALVFFALWPIVSFVYRVWTITSGSATWGMRLFAIELRQASGARMDFTAAILHTLGYMLSLASMLVHAISIILMLSSARGQSLVDHVLGTVMINRAAKR